MEMWGFQPCCSLCHHRSRLVKLQHGQKQITQNSALQGAGRTRPHPRYPHPNSSQGRKEVGALGRGLGDAAGGSTARAGARDPPSGQPGATQPPGGHQREQEGGGGAAICSWGGCHLVRAGGSRVRGWLRSCKRDLSLCVRLGLLTSRCPSSAQCRGPRRENGDSSSLSPAPHRGPAVVQRGRVGRELCSSHENGARRCDLSRQGSLIPCQGWVTCKLGCPVSESLTQQQSPAGVREMRAPSSPPRGPGGVTGGPRHEQHWCEAPPPPSPK